MLNSPVNFNDPTGHMCSDPEDPTPSCDGSDGYPPNIPQPNLPLPGNGGGNGGGGTDDDAGNSAPDLCAMYGEGCGGGKPLYLPVHDHGCQFSSELQYLCQLPQDAQDQVVDQIINSDGEFHPLVVSLSGALTFDLGVAVLIFMASEYLLPLALEYVVAVKVSQAIVTLFGFTVAVTEPVLSYTVARPAGTQIGDTIVRIESSYPSTRGLFQYTDYVFRDNELIDVQTGVNYGP